MRFRSILFGALVLTGCTIEPPPYRTFRLQDGTIVQCRHHSYSNCGEFFMDCKDSKELNCQVNAREL